MSFFRSISTVTVIFGALCFQAKAGCFTGPVLTENDSLVTYKWKNDCASQGKIGFVREYKNEKGVQTEKGEWHVSACAEGSMQWFPGKYTFDPRVDESKICIDKKAERPTDPNGKVKGAEQAKGATKAVPPANNPIQATTPLSTPATNLTPDCSADTQSCIRACIQLRESQPITCTKECGQFGAKGACFQRFKKDAPDPSSRESADLNKKITAAKNKAVNADKIKEAERTRLLQEEQAAVEARDEEITRAQQEQRRAAFERQRVREAERMRRAQELELQQEALDFFNGFLNGYAGAAVSSQPQYRAPLPLAVPTAQNRQPPQTSYVPPQNSYSPSPPYIPPPATRFVPPSKTNCSEQSAQACTTQ